jgi:hypothetical protein
MEAMNMADGVPMKRCGFCAGQGGEEGPAGEFIHCPKCKGQGELLAACACGAPAEFHMGFGEWVCGPCKAEIDADRAGQVHVSRDEHPTPALGLPAMPMRALVEQDPEHVWVKRNGAGL